MMVVEQNKVQFLGAFAKLRKENINIVVSVRPSVRMEQLSSYWTDFHDLYYLGIFRTRVEKILSFE